MEQTRYLIVGGGMTAAAAVKGIREHDSDGRITLVGAEPHPPYKRPPLTKKLWAGGDEEKIWIGTADDGAELMLGTPDRRARPRRAAGDRRRGRGVRLRAAAPRHRRHAAAARRRRSRRSSTTARSTTTGGCASSPREGAHAVVIGGGFIGSELAASLTGERRPGDDGVSGGRDRRRASSRRDSREFVTQYYQDKGVEVLAGETVASVDGNRVTTGSGRVLEADAIVAGLGIEPNVELAASAGLLVDNGIVVDEHGRAGGRDDVFAAGDVANFPSPVLGGRFRVEHEDHANTHGTRRRREHGRRAARSTTTCRSSTPTSSTSATRRSARSTRGSPTVENWEEPNRKGTIVYVDDDRRPRGVLLWNVWDKVDAARELIRAGEPVGERGRLSSALARSRKARLRQEALCEVVFRPLAHVVVLALAPLRVPPPVGRSRLRRVRDRRRRRARARAPDRRGAPRAAEDGARQRGRPARAADEPRHGLRPLSRFRVRPARERRALRRARLVQRAAARRRARLRRADGGPERQLQSRAARARRAAASSDSSVLGRVYAVMYGWQDRLVERFVELAERRCERVPRHLHGRRARAARHVDAARALRRLRRARPAARGCVCCRSRSSSFVALLFLRRETLTQNREVSLEHH